MGFSKNSVFLNLFHLLNHDGRRNSLTNNTQVFPWLLWHIWKSRNSFVFEGKSYDANIIMVKAREDAVTWMAANKSDATATNKSFLTASHTHHTWRCPMFSFGKYIRRFLDVFEFSVVVIATNECNRVAKEIATSITRDHRYQSYIAREGPMWLQEIITEESKLSV
ncbi:unnamed protein product [Arabidopsis halleri]